MSKGNFAEFLTLEDKGFEDFVPNFDHPEVDFFDQYVSHDSGIIDSNDTSNTFNGSNFFDTDFSSIEMEQSSGSSAVDSSSSHSSRGQQQPTDTWRHDSWRQHKARLVAQSQKLVHRNRPDGLAITGTELLGLEGKIPSRVPTYTTASLPPRTPTVTPIRTRTYQSAPRTITPVAPEHHSHRVSKPPHHISATAANLASPYTGQDSPAFCQWTERFQESSLQAPLESAPLTPPPSGRAPSLDQPTRLSILRHDESDGAANEGLPTTTLRRDSRTVSRHHGRRPSGIDTNSYPIPTPPELFESPQFASRPFPWQSQPPDNEEEGTDFLFSPLQLQYPWTMENNSRPSSDAYTFSPLDADFVSKGLLIGTDDVDFSDFLSPIAMTHSSNMHFGEGEDHIYQTTTSSSPNRASRPRYQTPPSPPAHYLTPPSTTIRSSSRVPYLAPSTRSSHASMSSLHHRRTKSTFHSHASIAGTPSKTPTHVKSTPSLSSNHHQQVLSSSSSHNYLPRPSTPLLSTTTNNQQNNVGFVNFTPSDSKRILTGVAPSGSSKTKARREKEAGERRRKLSEVAERAIREVGGDVKVLREGGLLV
ncbi:hypothetical protein MMC14_007669 [Varicellaria rhodocarpa]|nr:hypothetical protein [Varicellaria rhodocarpa]